MIDTHCHLTDPRLESQLEDVLARARAAGVSRFISVGTDIVDDRRVIELCRGRDDIRCAVGVHPNYTHEADPADLPRLLELQSDPVVLALGEMGLDYHHQFASRQRQMAFFEPQMQLAADVGKPVIIHSRDATDDTLAVMRGFPGVRAVFHCFTGTAPEAQKILDGGYFIGFTGALTFKKSDAIREAAALTPLDRMFIETDAPYLTPEPMRKQKINEPSLVIHVAEVLARVKGVGVEEIDCLTTENANRFFNWPVTAAVPQ